MTKGDIVNAVAQQTGVTKKSAADVLEALLQIIADALAKGEKVTLTGFGTFLVSHRAARSGVNPRKPSEKIKIPAMKLPAFRAGKTLKEAVR